MSRVFKVDYIPDPDRGRPLWNAKIFVGVANQDPTIPSNQIQLTGDIGFPAGQSIPVPQPVRTNAGGITVYNNSPLDLNAPGQEYAIQIFDRNDNLIYNFPQVDGSVVMNTTSQEEVTGLTIWPKVGEAVIGQTIPAGTDAIRYPFNGRSTLFTIKPPVAVTGTITNITINSNGIGELEVDNSDVYDLAEFNSFIAANDGDSQIAGGNIWPLSSQETAQVGDDLTSYSVLRLIGGDFTNANLFYPVRKDNGAYENLNGTLDSFSLTIPYEAVIDGDDYWLLSSKEQLDDYLSKTINFKNWGVVLDGTTDNSDALMWIRSAILVDKVSTWEIKASGGVCAYENNMWLIDVKNMEFDGLGCELRNINNSAATSQESRPLFIQRIFEGDIFNNVFDVHNGFIIQDAESGDGSVFTNTPADAGLISEGEWALIYGYDQQQFNGYLPNARFFDWVLVDSVNAGTGEIVLRGGNRLRNSYSNLWADGVAGGVNIGRPRIISTVRTIAQGYSADRTFPINRKWENVKFSNVNPLGQSWGDSAAFLEMKSFTVRNQGTFFGALGSKECIYDEIRFDQPNQKPETEFGMETDKLTEKCTTRRTAFGHGLAGGTGVDNLIYDNCSFPKNSRIRVGAKNQTFNECEILGCRSVSQPEYMLQASDSFSESTAFNSCRFRLNDDQEAIFRLPSSSKTIPAASWTAIGNRQISLTGDATANNFTSQVAIGTMLVIGDTLTDGNGQIGVVSDIRASGANSIVTLRGTQQTNFDDTQDIEIYAFNPPSYSNCSIWKEGGSQVPQPLTAVTPAMLYGKEPYKTIRYSSLQNIDLTFGKILYPCYVKEIRIDVKKTYDGADAEFFVEISRVEQGSQRIQVDVRTAGFRRFNEFEQTNLIGADTYVQNLFQTPNLQGVNCFIRTTSGGSTLPADIDTANVAPIYEVEIDLAPIVN